MVVTYHVLNFLRLTPILGLGFGFTGVPVFFMLSIYLLLGVLSRPGHSLKNYFTRRIRRTWLAYFIAITVTFFFLDPDLTRFVENLTFTEVWILQMPWGVFWSLQVEEVAYVLFPLVAILAVRSKAALAVVLIVIGLWTSTFVDVTQWIIPGSFLGYGMGILAYLKVLPSKLKWLSLSIVLVDFVEPMWVVMGITALALIGFAAVVADPPPFLSSRLLLLLGGISYSVYLWHLFFIEMWGVAYVVLVFPFAYFFEKATNLNGPFYSKGSAYAARHRARKPNHR